MRALKVHDVAIAVRQHHGERNAVDNRTIEISRRQREHGFYAVG